MTRPTPFVATCSAVAIAAAEGVPEWIHLLPAGDIVTVDGRGPYKVADMAAIAAAPLPGGKIPLDENHSTDKAAPRGEPSPARGWIVEMQARADGLWGRVDWTPSGRAMMEDRAYAGVSPVIVHTKDKRVLQVVRASLTNTPNLQGLTALHSEENEMDWKAKLIALLGLDSSADDAAVEAALSAGLEAARSAGVAAVAPQSQVNLLEHPTVIALQAQNSELAGAIKALKDGQARDRAVAFVDAAIAAGHVGVKPLRDEYIALHMEDPARAAKMIGALPSVAGRTETGDLPPESGSASFDAADRQVMSLFGVDEETYTAELKKSGRSKEAL